MTDSPQATPDPRSDPDRKPGPIAAGRKKVPGNTAEGEVWVDFALEPQLAVEEFIDVLRRSSLAERRPVEQRQRMARMLEGAQLLVTARVGGRLVGVARALTDFSYVTYVSDLAVDAGFQGRGMGRELLRLTHERAGHETMPVLLAAPKARSYYPHIGMRPHDSCWVFDRREENPRPDQPAGTGGPEAGRGVGAGG